MEDLFDGDSDAPEWTPCPDCNGESSWHDCGEDCCPCLYKRPNFYCDQCGGSGYVSTCSDPVELPEYEP